MRIQVLFLNRAKNSSNNAAFQMGISKASRENLGMQSRDIVNTLGLKVPALLLVIILWDGLAGTWIVGKGEGESVRREYQWVEELSWWWWPGVDTAERKLWSGEWTPRAGELAGWADWGTGKLRGWDWEHVGVGWEWFKGKTCSGTEERGGEIQMVK